MYLQQLVVKKSHSLECDNIECCESKCVCDGDGRDVALSQIKGSHKACVHKENQSATGPQKVQ